MDDGITLRPETHALDALIQATVTRVQGEAVASDALLFVGNRHEAFPVWVVRDPILEPIDKIVWMVIKLSARGTGTSAEFPSYVDVARQANIGARSTIARSIAILRITRWLSLCGRVREPCGRFRHNIYALHDEPIPLPDALHFDAQYLTFLNEAVANTHARVRNVARGVLESLDHDIAAQRDVCEPVPVFEQRLSAAAALHGARQSYFGFNHTATQRLRRFKDQDRNSVMEKPLHPPDVINSVSRSSSNSLVTKTTTTTTGGLNFSLPVADDPCAGLTFPTRFSANQRELAARHLAAIPAPLRQPILDETEGRFRAERRGMPAVYDDLRFLASLCRAALAGEFQVNLGLDIDAERQARLAERAPRDSENGAAMRDVEASRTTARASLAAVRATLGMPQIELGHTVSKPRAD